jgi:hypothetical protein
MLEVDPGCDEVATMEGQGPHGDMSLQHEGRIGLALCHVQKLLGHLASGAQLPLGTINPKNATECLQELRCLSYPLA